jgi:hypothetical protein
VLFGLVMLCQYVVLYGLTQWIETVRGYSESSSGLLRTFGYVGSIASSAITGMVFHHQVTDHGIHLIAWIMIGISLVLTVLTLADRTLRTHPAAPARP